MEETPGKKFLGEWYFCNSYKMIPWRVVGISMLDPKFLMPVVSGPAYAIIPLGTVPTSTSIG